MNSIAIYPGTFDPPTLGHLSILRRAAQLFNEVVVLVAINPDKETLFTPEERVEMWEEITADLPAVTVRATEDLVALFAASIEDATPVLIRGVRDAADLEFELLLAAANRELGGGLETIFLAPGPCLRDVSSTLVRQRLQASEPLGTLLHPKTARRLLGVS